MVFKSIMMGAERNPAEEVFHENFLRRFCYGMDHSNPT